MFRRAGAACTSDDVHERFTVPGRTVRLSGHILHYSHDDIAHHVRKVDHYARLMAATRHREGARFSLGRLLSDPIRRAFRGYVWRRGFLDGTQGLIICALTALYVFLIHAKLFDLELSRDGLTPPAPLDTPAAERAASITRPPRLALVRRRWVSDGGGERFTALLAGGLARAGCAVTIVSARWDESPGPVAHRRVPTLDRSEWLSLLSFTVNAARHLRREAYDLVQSHAKLLWQDVYRAGDGCHREWLRVRAEHQATPHPHRRRRSRVDRLVLFLERTLLTRRRYRLIVACSARVRADLIRHYAVPPEHIRVIYNGVDTERFHPAAREERREAARLRIEVPAGALLALFIGTGFERKGLAYLLGALPAAGEKVWLVVAGRDVEADGYRTLARTLGVDGRVRFLGPVTHPELAHAAADVLVLPTIYEPFSNACLEALASGLPVVTTRAAGVSELLSGRLDSLTVPSPCDPAALAERLRRLQDPHERRLLGAEARAVAEARSVETMADKFLEVYRTLGLGQG